MKILKFIHDIKIIKNKFISNHCCPVKVNKKEKEAIKMASQFKS